MTFRDSVARIMRTASDRQQVVHREAEQALRAAYENRYAEAAKIGFKSLADADVRRMREAEAQRTFEALKGTAKASAAPVAQEVAPAPPPDRFAIIERPGLGFSEYAIVDLTTTPHGTEYLTSLNPTKAETLTRLLNAGHRAEQAEQRQAKAA